MVIDEMESVVEQEPGARSAGGGEGASPAGGAPLDEDDFRSRYGGLLRQLVRDEIERYLRNLAD